MSDGPPQLSKRSVQRPQWYSYGVNKDHGLRRTNRDKQAAVEAALKHPKAAEMSNYEVAAHCGVSEITIRRAREPICDNVVDKPARTVKRGNSTYTQNTANIGKRKPEPQVLVTIQAPAPEGEPESQVLAPQSPQDTPLSLLREALGDPKYFSIACKQLRIAGYA